MKRIWSASHQFWSSENQWFASSILDTNPENDGVVRSTSTAAPATRYKNVLLNARRGFESPDQDSSGSRAIRLTLFQFQLKDILTSAK
mmetsp:Transcript_18381/g.45568  ORF Transcript_18381/g.45568 Transcript_18381/m.45568 type:complete len:88 (+) Transcript_18381:117-380(+)